MNTEDFIRHAKENDRPEIEWPPHLQALWHAERGEWEKAHTLSQREDTPAGAWVHANLHREEGDLSNARYWYHRAGKPESEASIAEERRHILAAFLDEA